MNAIPGAQQPLNFDGDTYDPAADRARLTGQALRVYEAIKDSQWRTLAEIEDLTRDAQASISARLRDFRKRRFGSHTVNRRHRGEAERGLYEYQLIPNTD
jgi:hypothetical protein